MPVAHSVMLLLLTYLLCGTLNARASRMSVMAFVIVVEMPVAHSVMLLLSVCLWVEIIEVHLINFVGEDRLIRRWQYGCKFFSDTRLQGRRENHVELNDESPFLEWVSVLRHAFSPHHLQVTGLDHLASHSLNDKGPVVQSLHRLLQACQRLRQADVHLHYEVLSIALEECVSLLVEDDDDVSRLKARLLVSLPREGHLLAVLHPLVHRHLQDLSLAVHFTPVALLAPELGINSFPLSVALPAHRLDLLHHSRTQLLDSHLHACSPAVRTLLNSARLATDPLTAVADNVLLESKLAHSAVVHVLQGHGELVHQVLRPARTSLPAAVERITAATSAEEHVEDVHGVHAGASTRPSLLDTLLARLVVELPLLRVGQHLVRHRDLLELVSRLRVFVRVILHGQLPVRLLQCVVVGSWRDPQNVVEFRLPSRSP